MAGLRAKQKEERQRRILEAARQQFRVSNYRDVTVENIAEEAGLSAMTVFNYYGSKGGLLLSLVAESDRYLVTRIDELLRNEYLDALSAAMDFSLTVFDHAFSYLNRQIWRHVLATSILEGNSTFGLGYRELEFELQSALARLLKDLKGRRLVGSNCDCDAIAEVIYNVHNSRFVEFVSFSDVTREEIKGQIVNDLKLLGSIFMSGKK